MTRYISLRKMAAIAWKFFPDMYLPKDFIVTPEGLGFAVLIEGMDEGKVLGFLRYLALPANDAYPQGRWQKIATADANALLANDYPDYLYYSPRIAASCHAIPVANIQRHFSPRARVQALLSTPHNDPVLTDCAQMLRLLQRAGVDLHYVGVTGSLLLGAQQASSDIDLVFYDAQVFAQARQALQNLLLQPKSAATAGLQALAREDWEEAYQRRDCDLTLAEYVWHEQRKYNKVLINRRKVDLSLLVLSDAGASAASHKLGPITLRCQVQAAERAYHYPAEYQIAATEVQQVLCFTATYIGQALAGEWIEVAGQLEVDAAGQRRLVVGSSREAHGEYIKVIAHAAEV